MNYCVILSAGMGSRVRNLSIPKQFYEINGIPIVIYTIKKFVDIGLFDEIYITIDFKYRKYMDQLLEEYIDQRNKIKLVSGGKERVDSIHNAVKIIERNNIGEDDIILIQDGVRPFVTDQIIRDNLECANRFEACVTVSPVDDTIIQSQNGEYVDNIPVRSTLFKGQSPDSFNLKKFIKMINNLTENQKKKITGTADICTFYNMPIRMVEGNNLNFKITTDEDLKIAELLLNNVKF